jgi:hypothetical protein
MLIYLLLLAAIIMPVLGLLGKIGSISLKTDKNESGNEDVAGKERNRCKRES